MSKSKIFLSPSSFQDHNIPGICRAKENDVENYREKPAYPVLILFPLNLIRC